MKTYKKFTYKEQSKKILNIIEDFQKENSLKSSFTNAFKNNIDNEINELLELLSKNGINFQNFFNNFKKEILADFNFYGDGYFMDYLLYTFEKSYPIGGMSLIEMEQDEKLIKYSYGYYKYDLGKKYILQTYKSLEDFYFDVAENFISSMLVGNEIRCNFQNSMIFDSDMDYKFAHDIQNVCTLVERKTDHTILIIDLYMFKRLLSKLDVIAERGESDMISNLETDLKEFEIKFWFDNSEFLLCAFGPNHKEEKVSEESKKKFKEIQNQEKERIDQMIDDHEMNKNVKKYNL